MSSSKRAKNGRGNLMQGRPAPCLAKHTSIYPQAKILHNLGANVHALCLRIKDLIAELLGGPDPWISALHLAARCVCLFFLLPSVSCLHANVSTPLAILITLPQRPCEVMYHNANVLFLHKCQNGKLMSRKPEMFCVDVFLCKFVSRSFSFSAPCSAGQGTP